MLITGSARVCVRCKEAAAKLIKGAMVYEWWSDEGKLSPTQVLDLVEIL